MKKNIFIVAGGTGGHLYPALAVADEIKKSNPDLDIHFVGSPYGIETRILPKYKYPLHLVPIGGLNQTSFLNKLLVLLKIPLAFLKSIFLLIKYNPKFVFGFGGYTSGPVVLLASLFCKKTAVFESNAIPGKTNRILSRFVRMSFVTFGESKKLLHSEINEVGFPVRAEMKPAAKTSSQKFRVLVFGGSQGARGINMTVSQAVQEGGEWLDGVELVHQTGKLDFAEVQKKYQGLDLNGGNHHSEKNIKVLDYLDPIKDYYDWADFVICRAGASTIAELSACGKAALLIPFPFATDNHQQKNAEALVEKNAAMMCIQKDFSSEYFKNVITKYKSQRQQLAQFESNIKQFHKALAAYKMAQYVNEEVAK